MCLGLCVYQIPTFWMVKKHLNHSQCEPILIGSYANSQIIQTHINNVSLEKKGEVCMACGLCPGDLSNSCNSVHVGRHMGWDPNSYFRQVKRPCANPVRLWTIFFDQQISIPYYKTALKTSLHSTDSVRSEHFLKPRLSFQTKKKVSSSHYFIIKLVQYLGASF